MGRKTQFLFSRSFSCVVSLPAQWRKCLEKTFNFQLQYVYTSSLLIIKLRFTCGERKICSNIKKSQNIMNMIAVSPRKFCIRRNNIKIDSIETGCIVIAHLLPWSDLEKCMYTTLFWLKILSSLLNFYIHFNFFAILFSLQVNKR